MLKSLVVWGTANTGNVEATGEHAARSATAEDLRHDAVTPDPSNEKISAGVSLTDSGRLPTPDQLVDDPTKFENAKQKKTTLLEGIKKFNYKPKRVGNHSDKWGIVLTRTCTRVSNSFWKQDSSAVQRLRTWHV